MKCYTPLTLEGRNVIEMVIIRQLSGVTGAAQCQGASQTVGCGPPLGSKSRNCFVAGGQRIVPHNWACTTLIK